MSLKNLNVNKVPKELEVKLFNKRIQKLYQSFEKQFLYNKEDFVVAISGGPDSLALAFLTKIFSLKNNLKCKYYIVDHKIRDESTIEAKKVKSILKNFSIESKILTFRNKRPYKSTQSFARKKRYELLFNKCRKYKIYNLILGHHSGDLIENFFIRMVRGSGLKGLVSFGKIAQINKINLIRPLLKFKKKDLIFISDYVFDFFVKDPTNKNEKYTRTRIRKLISELKSNGLDEKKLFLTIENLKKSDNAISYFIEQNKRENSTWFNKEKKLLLNQSFFEKPHEVVFRSLTDCIKLVGEKYNPVRGKKVDNIIKKIMKNSLNKETLGGCVIKKVNQTVILIKET